MDISFERGVQRAYISIEIDYDGDIESFDIKLSKYLDERRKMPVYRILKINMKTMIVKASEWLTDNSIEKLKEV